MASNNIAKGWENPIKDGEASSEGGSVTIAPEDPVTLIRDSVTDQVTQVVYGDMKRMMNGEPVVTWSEEIIRDETTNQIIGIQTMRPNGVITMETILRDSKGMFTGTELTYL